MISFTGRKPHQGRYTRVSTRCTIHKISLTDFKRVIYGKPRIQVDRVSLDRFMLIIGLAAARERAKAVRTNPARPWNA